MKKKNLVIYTLILVGLIVLLVVVSEKSKEATVNITFDEPPSLDGQPVLGDPNAKVSIVEFGDYKCPSCKQWNERIFPQLKEEYIDAGLANFAFINTLFQGEESYLASLAAEAVWAQDEEAFWTYHEALFNKQPAQQQIIPWVTKELLLEVAQNYTSDIDLAQLEVDLDQEKYIDQLEEDMQLVQDYNIEFTPSIIINGTLVKDPFDYDEIKGLIGKAVEEGQS